MISSKSRRGHEQLKNERVLIAKFNTNLVRLYGCYIEQGEKVLLYKYMPNKSLDFFPFGVIIECIVQILLYIYQYFTLRVILRDLKASAILFDKYRNSKISYFGKAKMFSGDELQSNTKRIGIFCIKSDVFSFRVSVLEIISSKWNIIIFNIDFFTLLGRFSIQTFTVFPLNFPTVHRPTMSEAVSMLTNEIVNIPLPISLLFKPKAFS
ncbi:hypothetical protein KPL70_026601 [Citrus sinensis]|uniref:Uncharacterized protein n=2 Tax=Citrus TaxID=2706 RepID=A0ACB8NZ06_CITSI|nr:hypothetical protein CICLE_v10010521mg [Citrus x clementina]KAH9651051.1 hypothetical protein KPL70_026601 [Citrus sinensis]KAH9802971.1 hypothetical protein KPL71_001597 [Citrus sinensis]